MLKKAFSRLVCIVSYGATLTLMFQLESSLLITLIALFVIGSVLIVWKMPYEVQIPENARIKLLLASLFVAVSFGCFFYYRWDKSRGLQQFVSQMNGNVTLILILSSVCLSVMSTVFLYRSVWLLFKLKKELQEKHYWRYHLLLGFFASAATFYFSQVMAFSPTLYMDVFKLLIGILAVYGVFLALYAVTGLVKCSLIISTAVFMLLSTVNSYVYIFRDRMLDPIDVFSVSTAMNVVDNYSLFPVPKVILASWAFYIGYCILFCLLTVTKHDYPLRKRAIVLAMSLISAFSVYYSAQNTKVYYWMNMGAGFNGFFLNFFSGVKKIIIQKPDNYSLRSIEKLSERYGGDVDESPSSADNPHIIVIMDEAFSDLSVVGDFTTETEVSPFISTLKENTVSGYSLVSVFGGNTSSSEFEFLTGNSMAWLPNNSVPYQQYVRTPTYSVVSYLKLKYGYRCMAYHPYLSSSWNRLAVYENLGFDSSFFLESFSQKDLIRGFVGDRAVFEKMIATYEKERSSPLFLFGVTIQNHGSYDYKGHFSSESISLSGYDDVYPKTEQYLSLIHETDKAVEYLVDYFSSVDDKVLIVFFGDHQPGVEDSFYTDVLGYDAHSLDDQQKKYKVPFFIWANYDIEEETLDCTSLNYLSSHMFKSAGLELPAYNRFLSEMEQIVPAMNQNGFYSATSRRFLAFEDASDEEREWLEKYQMLQYNNLFESKNRNSVFFPVL